MPSALWAASLEPRNPPQTIAATPSRHPAIRSCVAPRPVRRAGARPSLVLSAAAARSDWWRTRRGRAGRRRARASGSGAWGFRGSIARHARIGLARPRVDPAAQVRQLAKAGLAEDLQRPHRALARMAVQHDLAT